MILFRRFPRIDRIDLEMNIDPAWSAGTLRKLVTSQLLGRTVISNLPYEQADGSSVRIETDYVGRLRNLTNPTPGPFEIMVGGSAKFKVW